MEQTIETPQSPTPKDESSSLADHEAAFGRGGTGHLPEHEPASELEPVETPEPVADKPKYRTHSQRASADDVETINALTRELRTKEAELAKVRPDALAGTPRLLSLKRQIKAIEAELHEHQPKPEPPPERPSAPSAPAKPATAFDVKEPVLTDYEAEEDPYTSWLLAKAEWNFEKRAFDRAETARKEAAQQTEQQTMAAHIGRIETFRKAHPDYDAVIAADTHTEPPPPALARAIIGHDKSAEFLYHLGQHPEFFDEMLLLTEGRPVSDTLVAIVQRRLLQRVQAESTGAAAPRIVTPGPRPPTPVRTGPIHAGDTVPGDESSLAEHEKAFGTRRRR